MTWARFRHSLLRGRWGIVVLAALGVAFVVVTVMGAQDQVVAEQQAQQTQVVVSRALDPLAALCDADPSVQARVGEACDAAREVVDQPTTVIRGPEGRGITATVIRPDGHLVVSYTDGAKVDVGPVVGQAGANGVDGRGITSSTITNGELILTFTDGTTQSVGPVVGARGAEGPAGRGIASTAISEGRLLVSYTDGTTVDAGAVPAGANGTDGRDGSPAAELIVNRSDGTTVSCPRTGGDDLHPVYTCAAP